MKQKIVDFSKLHIDTNIPVYPQITDFIKTGILKGEIISGDELPSRRELAITIGINPNTSQKAYKALEDEGLLTTEATSKSKIVFSDETYAMLKNELIDNIVSDFFNKATSTGLTYKEITALIAEKWQEDGNEE